MTNLDNYSFIGKKEDLPAFLGSEHAPYKGKYPVVVYDGVCYAGEDVIGQIPTLTRLQEGRPKGTPYIELKKQLDIDGGLSWGGCPRITFEVLNVDEYENKFEGVFMHPVRHY